MNNFCILPWIAADIMPDGTVAPCCYFDRSHQVFNIENHSIDDYFHSSFLDNLKKRILANEIIPECQYCTHLEKVKGEISLRQRMSKEYASLCVSDIISSSKKDHFLKELTLRNSKICNLACRTCCPQYSSTWEYYVTGKSVNIVSVSYDHSVITQLKHLRTLYLLGGEPLLNANYDRYLHILLQEMRSDIYLEYTTNLAVSKKMLISRIDLWRQFENLTFVISMDAVGEQAEYLRYNLNWNIFVDNLSYLISALPNATFKINTTLSIYNILSIHSIINFINTNPLFRNIKLIINPLINPGYLNIQNLPSDIKQDIVQEYRKEKCSSHHKQIDLILKYLSMSPQNNYKLDFNILVKKLDRDRGESFSSVFPRLYHILYVRGYVYD